VAYQVRALRPPKGYLGADSQLKLAADEALAFTSEMRQGMETKSPTTIKSATTHMQVFESHIISATGLIKTATLDDTCP
jgi:hypothetical protein